MITKEDFLNYLSELEMIEQNMRDIYGEIIPTLKDKHILEIFNIIYKDEVDHAASVNNIKKIVISKIFDSD